MQPEITVLMPARNCEAFIAEAIQSVLNQTFSDFELIVMDDGSTDGTRSVIERFDDPRIRFQKNKPDFIATLNRGLASAAGKYLARTDADDVMPVDRLAIEHALLEEYPEIDVCSGWMQLFGQNVNEQISRTTSGWIDSPLLFMLRTNFVFNATTMCRMDFIRKHRLTYKHYPYAEDYLFWSEAARKGARFYVESQILHFYRMWENQVGRKYKREQVASTWKIKKEIVSWLVVDRSDNELTAFHQQACQLNENGKLSDKAFVNLFYQLCAEAKEGRSERDE